MYKRFSIVSVKFRDVRSAEYNSKEYTYLTDMQLEPGNLVVVDTVYGPNVAKVWSTKFIDKHSQSKASRLVIGKIDMTQVEDQYKVLEEVTSLRQQLDDRKQALEDIQVLRFLAKTDPVSKDILDRIYMITGDPAYLVELDNKS